VRIYGIGMWLTRSLVVPFNSPPNGRAVLLMADTALSLAEGEACSLLTTTSCSFAIVSIVQGFRPSI
jgi:hypothetical protein